MADLQHETANGGPPPLPSGNCGTRACPACSPDSINGVIHHMDDPDRWDCPKSAPHPKADVPPLPPWQLVEARRLEKPSPPPLPGHMPVTFSAVRGVARLWAMFDDGTTTEDW